MKALYSPVGPIGVLEFMKASDMLGGYLLLLAHEVLKQPERYRVLLEDFHGMVIMDNGVIEMGAALPANHLVEAAHITNADVIVLPDVIGEAKATVNASIMGAERLRQAGYGGDFMAAPQGSSLPGIAWCAQEIAVHVEPRWWGVGRWIANAFGTRESVVRMLGGGYYGSDNNNIRIHLLGMSEHLDDDVHCAKLQGVVGIDSANPLVAALNDQVLFRDEYQHVSGDVKAQYWQLKYGERGYLHWKHELGTNAVQPKHLMNIKANVTNLRRVINGQPTYPYP